MDAVQPKERERTSEFPWVAEPESASNPTKMILKGQNPKQRKGEGIPGEAFG
jgi:hypothetical protein